jgi:hypothetical protein
MRDNRAGEARQELRPKRLSYFAYRWNLDPQEMSERCPGAVLRGVARLDGYRFVVNRFGVATIVQSVLCRTFGVLWAITLKHRARSQTALQIPFISVIPPYSKSQPATAQAVIPAPVTMDRNPP